ncbi:hypothetical protein [Idiomarina sp.]|uniref:hypothetical protein n=1 Tax=Idiomarina sp. TaxID=1874361 RepID=UPI0025C6C133|nr:hypothetical protein [Idiomarina sp.]
MIKENIFTVFAFIAVFSLGSAIAFSKDDVSTWFDFIGAFSALGLLGLSIYALFYWRKQEKYKNRARVASTIVEELAKPVWQLELAIARHHVSKFTAKSEGKHPQPDFEQMVMDELSKLGTTLKNDVAYLTPFISDEFNEVCMNWVFELATSPKTNEIINYGSEVVIKFREMRRQLLQVASFEIKNLNTKEIQSKTTSYSIHKGFFSSEWKNSTKYSK